MGSATGAAELEKKMKVIKVGIIAAYSVHVAYCEKRGIEPKSFERFEELMWASSETVQRPAA